MNHPANPIATLPLKSADQSLIGSLLADLGKLDAQDIDKVLRLQHERGIRFGEAARNLGLVDESDIQHALSRQFNYPYLQPGQGGYPSELIAAYQPFGRQVETLRSVRAQLMQTWFTNSRKMLAIASINQGEGASFFAANMAVLMAQLGRHTLLVDANLRRPRQHRIFALPNRHGLSDLLARRAGLDACTKIPAFPHLTVLGAGTLAPNPQELLGGSSFPELSDSISRRYDTVLVDMCAFAAGADALTVAARVGGVLLVCRRNKTAMAGIQTVSAQLARAGATVVGAVLLDF